MLVTEVNEALPGGSSLLRNEPVQARSSARLTGLLDAAASIIDEIGFERLTTAMVAERAGASIGTVYRYFPDRIAVVEALAVRGAQRFVDRVSVDVSERDITRWADSIDIVIDALVEMYRTEPGFRAIRFGDSETADKALTADTRRPLAEQLTTCLVDRFGIERTADVEFAIEVATETGSALVARAFFSDPAGDARFIDQSRALVSGYLDTALNHAR
ncbi:hypothetical protein AX769_14335 [Frondihabitans sp. PAMC 28766]|uniref:TetR/AcrR family transcriptional regulator n=1 Tax=Frondihabitans sp. PAMC 28766 TaxID=1795630 RepID=UPI00078E48CC|nr:TetR/AcrR family transcriptional regulator [Frondihabitans sp. PAMC 28766]AMM22449.1 hypothetical protein AX769_14335 [Frondihabitans sp. PAMC 28766]